MVTLLSLPNAAPVEVCLVTMPYGHVTRPSIALGILKSCLRRGGISCGVEYANLLFAEQVGLEVNSLMSHLRTDSLIGEWTFAQAAFRDGRDTLAEILGRARSHQPPNLPRGSLDDTQYAGVFSQIRAFVPEFVDEVAHRVLSRNPRIVGCTSTFEQHCPALALLRRIRELAPGVVTLLGGANCEGVMGWTTLRYAPWVDFVVSGEADELFLPLCQGLLEHGAALPVGSLPPGVLSQAHVALGRDKAFFNGKIPRAVVADMNASPPPDFDEYFAALEVSPLREFIVPALAVESSRGCWWGQKSHCTFCGLNGAGMNYRSKSADLVLKEWSELGRRYPTRKMTVVDNIIDMRHVKTLLPELARMGGPFELFYEVKANLRREQIQLFARAGITKIQPGIEGLHDDLLKLMAKGNSAMINIQLLKYARESGIMSTWMLLVGFPGEEDAWHEEVARWLPLVTHLQPPNGVVHVRYDRFSVYFNEPEKHGLDLEPFPAYRAVYPVPPEDLRDLAYFFFDANCPHRGEFKPGVLALGEQVRLWKQAFNRTVPPVFCVTDRDGVLEFFDTRPCAPVRRTSLEGLPREIYLACDTSTNETELIKRFTESGAGGDGGNGGEEKPGAEAVRVHLREMVERKLLLHVHGKFLAIACFGEVPALGQQSDYPNGYVEKFDPRHAANAAQAWARLRSDCFVLRPEPLPSVEEAPLHV